MNDYRVETLCLQGGYRANNSEPHQLPIYQSTTYKYNSSVEMGKLFDLEADGHMYTRISNPTVAFVEAKIAALEGGVGAMCTSSGQAASLTSVFNIARAGQNFLCMTTLYGGTVNLFAVTMQRMGIEVRFVSPTMSDEEIEAKIDENTRLFFGETIANPALDVFDIERYAALAHRHGMPLIVDNTFATPIFCRPIEYGADIVIHSTTKYMDGHASVVGGVIVDGGTFDWSAAGRYPELSAPDDSYHGVIYTEKFGRAAYITKARVQLMRDMGVTPQPLAMFLLNTGLETLAVRMERHAQNALAVAQHLEKHPKIAWVSYPLLPSSPEHARAMKYLKGGCCGVISLGIRGGRDAATVFMDSLNMATIAVHVADARTLVLHPASTTHRQLTDEQLVAAGITPEMVRLSVGIEHVDDIIRDLDQALERIEV